MTVWQEGMRCVFVKSYGPFPGSDQYAFPVEGRVYTVRDVVISIVFGEQCLRLHEISNVHMVGRVVPYAGMGLMRLDSEPAFDADRFRPLSESRLDQFRKLLAPVDRVSA